jgi:hypothetical protein
VAGPIIADSKKFTEDMFRKVGLTTETQDPRTAVGRSAPANLHEHVNHKVTVSDDHMDVDSQRRLAGITTGKMNFPNPSGPVGVIKPGSQQGMFDLGETLAACGITEMPRLYESRGASEVKALGAARKRSKLEARRADLVAEVERIDEALEGDEAYEAAGPHEIWWQDSGGNNMQVAGVFPSRKAADQATSKSSFEHDMPHGASGFTVIKASPKNHPRNSRARKDWAGYLKHNGLKEGEEVTELFGKMKFGTSGRTKGRKPNPNAASDRKKRANKAKHTQAKNRSALAAREDAPTKSFLVRR